VAVGQTGRVEFFLQAPLQPGVYTENFALVAENYAWVKGAQVAWTINVSQSDRVALINEPDIRVGLYSPTGVVRLTMSEPFMVMGNDGQVILQAIANEPVTIGYQVGIYTVQTVSLTQTSSGPVSITAVDGDGVIEILNYENRPSWNLQLNDNKFRHQIDVQYAGATQKLWVINQLPVESYLRGIAEAGNDNPDEYLKAMSIAERTYAMYHVQRQTKHANENYTVDATYDQVYRGYGFEIRAPHIVEMVEATAGQIVTYNGDLAITPYYSHSDGRTRSWEEVWSGGPYPWLVSVTDLPCQGMMLLGHGVGLSALGARSMAVDGSIANQILAHYYTGTSITKFY
jgi:peptidoglycan hydrolase-like amidase